MKNLRFFALVLSVSLISCQINPNNFLGSKNGNTFNTKNIATEPSPISSLPILLTPPNYLPDIDPVITNNNDASFIRPKEHINFDFFPEEGEALEKGMITVIYHNNDKFRVKTNNSISSINSGYEKQINTILKKYNLQSVHSYGYYDPADKNRIICKGKDFDIDNEKDKNDKNDKDAKKFQTKSSNENEYRDDSKEKKCNTLNYVDSAFTEQKLLEEKQEVSSIFEGEFPDKLSIHLYEFPQNADTRKIALEIKSLSFVRSAYPNISIGSVANNQPSCNIKSKIIGFTDTQTIKPVSNTGPKSDSIFPNDRNFYYSVVDNTPSDEKKDWYWFNQQDIFRGWKVYDNTPMPKIAVIDEGFNIGANAIDSPNYVEGFSVKNTGKKQFLWWSWDTFGIDKGNSNVNVSGGVHGSYVTYTGFAPKNGSAQGSCGIAPNSEIIPIKIEMKNEVIAKAIDEAAKDPSVDVINLSMALDGGSYAITELPIISRSIISALKPTLVGVGGKIVVIAAGNKGTYKASTNKINGVIVVGATTNIKPDPTYDDRDAYIWKYSSHGPIVDIAAAGDNIVVPNGTSGYIKVSGTSLAAPQISAAAGMIKNLAKQNGVNLDPYQVKQILCYSSNLGYDPSYIQDSKIGKPSNPRYIGLDLIGNSNTATENNPSRIANIRYLNLYNALTIAKNLSSYNIILRQYNTDDYVMSATGENWLDYFDFRGSKVDEIIGLTDDNRYKTTIDFKTLNETSGYAYGYQLFYGKKYESPNLDFYAGYNFFDKFDGVTGLIGAKNNLFSGKGFVAIESEPIYKLGYNGTCNSNSFSTKASLIYGTTINGTTSNELNSLAQDIQNLKSKDNDIRFLAVSGNISNPTIAINGINQEIIGKTSTAIAFKVNVNLASGIKDVILTTDEGTITLPNALDIKNNNSTKFPNSITVNGVTTNLDYGFNFDFNESSGSTVIDSSGKNNNGEFATLHGLLPLRVNNDAINFQQGSYITVPYSPTYNLSRRFTFLATMKLHEKNRQQLIFHKWEDGYVNGQLPQSYGFYLDSTNKITLTLSDNKSNYFSITHNADLSFDLEKEIGIAVIVDLDAKTVKMIKNQTIVDGNVLYDGIGYHYSSLNQFDSVKNSTIPLAIGNYTSILQGDWSLDCNLNADLTNVASVISEVTPEQVSKIFYDMGLRN